MSTNSECVFYDVDGIGHYYLLEYSNAPKNAWDWREYATLYGPFVSEDAAHKHLGRHHANPGGFWSVKLNKNEFEKETAATTDRRRG